MGVFMRVGEVDIIDKYVTGYVNLIEGKFGLRIRSHYKKPAARRRDCGVYNFPAYVIKITYWGVGEIVDLPTLKPVIA